MGNERGQYPSSWLKKASTKASIETSEWCES